MDIANGTVERRRNEIGERPLADPRLDVVVDVAPERRASCLGTPGSR